VIDRMIFRERGFVHKSSQDSFSDELRSVTTLVHFNPLNE
jgi:hypothetical protein